ncbi:MAG: fatty acid desaturase family protein [Vulcanococcus sp.]
MAQPSPERIVLAELNRCRRELPAIDRGGGALRITTLLSSLSAGAALYWGTEALWMRLTGLAVLSASEALLLIATHEACHGTLLKPAWLEQLLSAAVSWPMAWPYLSYRRLHQLHHRWNGRDLRDPERVNPLPPAQQPMPPAQQPMPPAQQPMPLPIWRTAVLEAGLGLMLKTYRAGWELRDACPQLRRTMPLDAAGVIGLQALFISISLWQGALLEYLISWIVVERTTGALLQLRGLIEHWGLVQPKDSAVLEQLYCSRTIKVGPWWNGVLGGLPYHAAHHAYPSVPSALLPQLTEEIERTLSRHQYPPLPASSSYWQAIRELR